MEPMKKETELASNRKAFHEYEIFETFEAGLVLTGTEIKSLRQNGASLQEAYIDTKQDALYLVHCYIAPYSFGNLHNHESKRKRKLLLHKREIRAIQKGTQEKGRTAVPLSLYLKKGFAKLSIGLGKGKKLHDKRASLKEKEAKRTVQRTLKEL